MGNASTRTRKKSAPLVGVLLGSAPTAEKAAQIVDQHRHCPYCVSYRSSGQMVIGVFSIPQQQRWWLQWVAEAPEETLGLESAAIAFPQAVEVLSPWARGEVCPELEQTPCGVDCRECSRYGQECAGCPATRYYLGGHPSG